jgi:hypothetical protein
MNWSQLKYTFEQEQVLKPLKVAITSLDALQTIEKKLKIFYPDIINNPSALLNIDKGQFKKQVARSKESRRLNSAEDKIINDIYRILKEN